VGEEDTRIEGFERRGHGSSADPCRGGRGGCNLRGFSLALRTPSAGFVFVARGHGEKKSAGPAEADPAHDFQWIRQLDADVSNQIRGPT